MKFIINKVVLLSNLQKVLGPTTNKQNFPILNSVLISAEKNRVKFTATDLDTSIISFQDSQVIIEGRVAVSMRRFISIIRELPPQDITLEKTANVLLISCEKVEFKISTIPEEEFPKIEPVKQTSLIKILPRDLEEMIRLTSFCVGYEDTNYVLGGILFEVFKDEMSLVSTDGKRLSFVKRKLPATQPELSSKIAFILPVKAVNEAYKLIKDREEEMFLFVEENKVGFDLKEAQFIARPIEGQFPDYSQYIPKEGKEKLIISRENFLGALRRADLLSTPDYQGIKVEIKKEKIVVSKNTPQLGEAKEVVDASWRGAALNIGFNPTYLIDVLRNLEDEQVGFFFSGADKPAILKKQDYIYLVLPMKI